MVMLVSWVLLSSVQVDTYREGRWTVWKRLAAHRAATVETEEACVTLQAHMQRAHASAEAAAAQRQAPQATMVRKTTTYSCHQKEDEWQKSVAVMGSKFPPCPRPWQTGRP
jgi:hypothetical protein